MNEDWKIYTKTGDKGETSLIGGTRVPKFHDRIEAYGTVDELNSYIGLIRDQVEDHHYRAVLLEIQDRLFTAESLLAADKPSKPLPGLIEEDILLLEKEIDAMNAELPELHSFILPGGHVLVSHCHVARCICRRTERLIIKLAINYSVEEIIIKYFNRLSDYLFVLARKLGKDYKVADQEWKARL